MAGIRPGQKGTSLIVDAGKRVVAYSDPSVVLRGTRFSPPGFDGLQMGLSGEKSVLVSQVISFGAQQFHIFVEGPASESLSLAIQSVRITVAACHLFYATLGIIPLLSVEGTACYD